MGIFARIKKRISGISEDWDEFDGWNGWEDSEGDNDYDYGDGDESDALGPGGRDWGTFVYSREHIDVHDHKQRHDYVVGCLEQIADAARELENLEYEYNMVTSYLRDIEEIEALPPEEKKDLQTAAARVNSIRKDRGREEAKDTAHMPDAKFA